MSTKIHCLQTFTAICCTFNKQRVSEGGIHISQVKRDYPTSNYMYHYALGLEMTPVARAGT